MQFLIELLMLWYMFPIALLIATTAMLFGIGGAVFFSTFFIVVLQLDPAIAISLGLIIEVFGFSSGLIGYARRGLINYHLTSRLLPFALIAAIVGGIVGKAIPALYLEVLLALVILVIGVTGLRRDHGKHNVRYPFHHLLEEPSKELDKHEHQILSGEDFRRDIEENPQVFLLSTIGGLLLGLSSAGLGEVNEFSFVRRLKMELGTAAGTSVLLICICAVSVSVFNISYFSLISPQSFGLMLQIAIFAIPGVVIGGQLGPWIAKRIDTEKALKVLPFLFIFIAAITILRIVIFP